MKLDNPDLIKNKLYIGGKWLPAADGTTYDLLNPVDQEKIATVASAGKADIENSVSAASDAFLQFSGLLANERAALLMRWNDLILANKEDLARLITYEMGKPIAESRGEVAYGASFVSWFAEEARRVRGDMIPGQEQDKRIMVVRQPVGVCAAITPWNFPIAMITRKVAPALAAGCTVVAKPASQTPLAATALVVLAQEAGIPPGVLNLATSNQATVVGDALTGSAKVRKLTFTGSTLVGKHLYRQCAEHVKKISLELGGNAPFIVFDDADIAAAVDGAIASKFRNTGQTCVCANRIFVQEGVYDDFTGRLAAKVASLKVGPGIEEGCEQGPLVNQAGLDKVIEHVEDAKAKGAKVETGGGAHERGGLFYQPTVLSNVSRDMVINDEETFGPVAPLMRFTNRDEVIELANDTPFGLAAYVYSRDIGNALRSAERLEAGVIGVNTGIFSTAAGPFGGVKESGIGREGSYMGIDEFLEAKYICLGGIS